MSEMDDELTDINVETCPINELWEFDVERLETYLFMLETEHRLCLGTGEDVIAEFGFKGNYGSVLMQLREVIDKIKELPYTEADRAIVLQRLDRYTEHLHNKCDPYHDEILKKVRKHTMEGLTEALDLASQKRSLNRMLHEKKECLCYVN